MLIKLLNFMSSFIKMGLGASSVEMAASAQPVFFFPHRHRALAENAEFCVCIYKIIK